MSLLIDIVDETGSVSEEMLKEVENLLQFAAEREGVQDQAEVSVTIVSNDDIHQINKEYRERMLRQMSSHLLLKKRRRRDRNRGRRNASGFR